jgi:serine-type D-Ala-D-Ala carboxypeptidase/endopeptidase
VTPPGWARAAADALARGYYERDGQPGLVYGIVAGGTLVHARGFGEQWLGGPAPGTGTVFRIASMTKSFTAAAVLTLRDSGKLRLDDPAAGHVPQLRQMPGAPADSPPLTIRHLLTMTAGFPTDDPWGDRQQGLPLAEFGRFLAGGVSYAWAPGTQFEYSNLGYAILGLIISEVSGASYQQFVRDRLLRPLGMHGTGFEAREFGVDQLAKGYRYGAGGWHELPPEPSGAFAPMGGIYSCVADLATWVSGFLAAFPTGGKTAGAPHPLRRASRREMQLPAVAVPPLVTRLPGDPVGAGRLSYGLGLAIEDDPGLGRVVAHGGGYPGFGSFMRWHLASGTGVIVLANSTYAGVAALAARLLRTVVPAQDRTTRRLVLSPGGPWAETVKARQRVSELLRCWDDTVADELFSPNVAQDSPYPERQQRLALLRERIGEFRDDGRPPEFDTPAHCRWWLRGDHEVVQAEILLTPQRPPKVQALRIAVPPAAGSALARLVDTLISLLNDGAPGWPPSLSATPWLDTGLTLRQLRMAAGWAGRCVLGAYRAGDGHSAVSLELDGEHARLLLTVAADPDTGAVRQLDILLAH